MIAVSCVLVCVVSFTGRDPSLEIKYRPRKTKEKEEKESEPEREEKLEGDGSSTPQPKTDKRRGSQVTWQPGVCSCFRFIQAGVEFIVIFAKSCTI